jgi:CheY-like chemotaxis protein
MPDPETAPARVLVVDDNVVTRRLLQLHLSALGYQSILAAEGETGLEMAREHLPDAILLDIQLPGIDGLEVCRRLRHNERTATLPIIMVTSMSDVGTRVAGFDAGADDYVIKPFEAKELGARLRAHIALAQQRRRLAAMAGVFGTLRMLAHDFNNPLQAAIGGLHMVAGAPEGDPGRAEGLRMAEESVGELAELARRLHSLTEPVFKSTPIGPMLDVAASTPVDKRQ